MVAAEPLNNFWELERQGDSVIVFVHGVMSDSRSCWTSAEKNQRSVSWPGLIRLDRRLERYSIFLAGYQTGLDAAQYDIHDCAREVFEALNQRDVHERRVLDRHRIVFICHSMGGVVARALLKGYWPAFATKIIGLFLVASPTDGSPYANRLAWLTWFYRHRQGQSLRWGSWSLRQIDREFTALRSEARIPALVGREAIEHHFVLHRKWLPPLRPVVEIETFCFGRPERLPGTDHFSIAKPISIDAPVHRSFVALHQSIEDRYEELESLAQNATVPPNVLRQSLPLPAAPEDGPTATEQAASEFARLRTSVGRRSLAEALSIVLVVCSLAFLIGYLVRPPGPLPSNSPAASRQERFEKALDMQSTSRILPISSRNKEAPASPSSQTNTSELERATMIATETTWEPLPNGRGILRASVGEYQFQYMTGDSHACILNAPDSGRTRKKTVLAAVGIATVGMGIRALSLLSKEEGVKSSKWLVGTGAGALVFGYLTNQLQKSLETEEQRKKLAAEATYWSTAERGMEGVCRQITDIRLRARGFGPKSEPFLDRAGYLQLAALEKEANSRLAACLPPQRSWPYVPIRLCQ